jgi:hypothetical protein
MVNWLDDKMPEISAVTLRKAPRGRATVIKICDEIFAVILLDIVSALN